MSHSTVRIAINRHDAGYDVNVVTDRGTPTPDTPAAPSLRNGTRDAMCIVVDNIVRWFIAEESR